MLLTLYKPVPSGMSFDLDIAAPAPPATERLAYVLSNPGNAAIVNLTGTGAWTVEVLTATDGVNYTSVTKLSTPGQWRYETKTVVAIAIRVINYTSGTVTGMLAHGGPVPFTDVSPLFGTFLVFSYNATPSEPPIGNQIRFNSASLPAVTKVWLSNTTVDGSDQYYAVRHIPFGGTLLVQERSTHTDAVLFNIVGPPVDKGAYVEIPVVYQQHVGILAAAQALVAVFNPGPLKVLSPVTVQELPALPEPGPEPK